MNSAIFWVEILAGVSIPISVLAVIVNRTKTDSGLSVRSIQFLALAMLVPLLIILGLEEVLTGSTIGTLLGAFVGYLFGNIGKYDERKAGISSSKAKSTSGSTKNGAVSSNDGGG